MNRLRRRLLLLSYHFPPSSEVAAKPTARLVRHLGKYGWDVVVLTIPESDVAVRLDHEAYADVVERTRIEKVARWPGAPDGLRALGRALKRRRAANPVAVGNGASGSGSPRRRRPVAKWLLSYFTYPDLHAGWVGPVVRRASRLLRGEQFDALLTVAPPHSASVAGWLLHRRFPRLPWLAHMHDPWLGNPYQPPGDRLQARCTAYLERQVVQSASAICLATKEAATALAGRYPQVPHNRFCVLPNGYDPLDFPARQGAPRQSNGPIRFVYAGSLYGGRDPRPFLRGLAQALNQFKTDVAVELIGDLEPAKEESLKRMIAELGLHKIVTISPPIAYSEALDRLAAADVLLLFAQGQPDQIPAKLYEYLSLGRPILAFTDGASARVIQEAATGRVVGPSDDVAAIIADLLVLHRKGRLSCSGAPTDHLKKYQAPYLAGELAMLLDQLATRSSRRRA